MGLENFLQAGSQLCPSSLPGSRHYFHYVPPVQDQECKKIPEYPSWGSLTGSCSLFPQGRTLLHRVGR